jgi:GH35 family endo-1,4-beta-xylanase
MFHTINDAKRCAFWRLLRYLKESGSGVIGLQTHAGALSVVRYKDISITELPATKGN